MNRLQVLVFLIIALVTTARGFKPTKVGCSGPVFKINNVYYIREVLKEGIDAAHSLSYDHSTNTLFMAYNHKLRSPMREQVPAKINLDTNEFQIIDGIKVTLAVSVDAKTNDVYIAQNNDIYKYDKNNDKVELYFASNKSVCSFIAMLYAKDALYFSGFPSRTLYKVENGEMTKVKSLDTTKVNSFVIDDDDNMFFKNQTGVYSQKKGSEEIVHYQCTELLPDGGVTRDNAGEIYAFGEFSGIYTINRKTNVLENVMDDNVVALTFDGDNYIIYSDYHTLYRLKPNTDPNCI